MLLRQFKGTGPGTIFLISVILLAVWASAFIRLKSHFSLYFDLDPMPLYGILSDIIGTNPLPGIIFSILLVSVMAFQMVNLNTNIFFINERTFLPALFYILISGLIPQYQLLNPAIFSAIFLMLAIRRIIYAYQVPGIAYSFFDAGILIGTGSLFYANLIWFGSLVIIGILLLRTSIIKEVIISVMGLVTPFILTYGIYYITGKDLKELSTLIEYNLFGKQAGFSFTHLTTIALILAGLCTLVSIVYLLMQVNTKKIKSRKTFSLLLWLFVIAAVVYTVVPSVSVEIIWIAGIPVSYFWTHYFVFSKKKLIPEIFFSVILILILLIQVWYLR
ncbi:MAG TPA: DUF6427 family protein [Bacteroidales bacterium]